MKEEFLENKRLYSPYILCVYLLLVGLITYFYPSDFLFFKDLPLAKDPARSAFLISGAFFIFQIYNVSTVLYQRLIDTIVVIALILTLLYPLMCFVGGYIFSPIYFYFVFINLLIIYFILNDKNK
ncbi:hypothetical protein N9O83_03625 [Flavobacteriales bacterium]|nr:hypothetical protein [Flavobacteriales bacterium]